MEILTHNTTIEPLSRDNVDWAVNVATVNMLTDEFKRPHYVNIPQLYNLADMMMAQQTAFVTQQNGSYTGLIGGFLIKNIFNPKIQTLSEAIWYVLPEYRQGRSGFMLLQALEKRAEEIADELTMSLLPHSGVLTSSLERRGFILAESGLYKQINKG